jgi:multicomponent Na+:H+ antiporter subunit C
MELLLVFLIGALYASGVYLILRRSMVRLLLGIILLGNGTNILIFLPIPQALILTAIVISFGLTSFAIVLLKRVYALLGTDDLDTLNTPQEEDI